MKVVPSFLLAIAFSSAAYAGSLTETASYQLSGECQGQDGTVYGSDSLPGQVILSNITKSNAEIADAIDFAMVGSGPTDDGFQGCRVFVDLMKCASKIGVFQIDDGQSILFSVPATVLEFTCSE